MPFLQAEEAGMARKTYDMNLDAYREKWLIIILGYHIINL
jgi:hypothetical protein